MTAGSARIVDGRGGRDPLRRAILTGLALYLMPAVLVVLLVGALGLTCCAVLRLIGGPLARRAEGGPRRDGPSRAVAAPHVREVRRFRSADR